MLPMRFLGTFRLAPQVVFNRPNEEMGKADYLLVEKTFQAHEKEIQALPEGVILTYNSHFRGDYSLTDQVEIRFVTQYDQEYVRTLYGTISTVRPCGKKDKDKEPAVAIPDLIQRAIKTAQDAVAFFKAKDFNKKV